MEQTFSDDKSTTQAINFNSPITIIDQYASCASSSSPANYRAGIKVSATPNIHASVNYGVVASGTVVPPVRLLHFAVRYIYRSTGRFSP